MNLRHVALRCGTEENADKLFVALLGLKKSEPIELMPVLVDALFGIDAKLRVINYQNDHILFEVFIDGGPPNPAGRLDHVCLAVEDLAAFVQKCHLLGMKVIQAPKGDRLLTFIRDLDGNLFEIKEK